MKTKAEFIKYLGQLSKEMVSSSAEVNDSTERFFEGLAAWLDDTSENPPQEFDWDFAAKLMRAGVYYE